MIVLIKGINLILHVLYLETVGGFIKEKNLRKLLTGVLFPLRPLERDFPL